MRTTRALVTGKYENKSTYVLYKEDGSIFQTIREGEEFKIGNQMRGFIPVRVPHKKGKGTILMCQKRDKYGFVLEQFPLPHNKTGLWAITSGAARNGVFHAYHAPQNELEAYVASQGTSLRIIEKVDSINNMEFEVGGPWGGEYLRPWGWFLKTDGKINDDFDPAIPAGYQYHAWVANATYVIRYKRDTAPNGGPSFIRIERVVLTPQADKNKILEELKTL